MPLVGDRQVGSALSSLLSAFYSLLSTICALSSFKNSPPTLCHRLSALCYLLSAARYLLSALCYLLSAICWPNVCRNPQFMVVVDGGSSGSRVFVYEIVGKQVILRLVERTIIISMGWQRLLPRSLAEE
jgi:hypothetical protein